MAGNANFSAPLANSQSFASPTNSIDPSLQITQQQIQRQSDLAAALRQMSFEPIDASNGGNIAWTQGMAKIAQAIAGRIVQNRADKKQIQLNKDYQTALGVSGLYGSNTQPGGGGHSSGGGGQAPPPASIAPPAPTMAVPDANSAPPSGIPQAPPPTMPQPGQAGQPATMPPQAAPQQQAQFVPGPLSLGRDVRQNIILAQQYPEQYGKSLTENVAKGSAPTEVEILQQHIQQAISSGDMGAAQALIGQLNKVNHIDPIAARNNSVILDPITHQPIFQVADAPTGAAINYVDGKPAGMHTIDNSPEVMRALNVAQSGGTESGKAPYELVTVVDPITGKGHQVTKASLLPGGGGAPPPLSPSGSGAPNTGTVGGYYANLGGGAPGPTSTVGNVSSLGPRATAAEAETGTQSAQAFAAATKEASSVRNQQMIINHMLDEVDGLGKNNQLPTGAGAAEISHLKSSWNSIVGAVGGSDAIKFDPDKIARFDELKKNTAQLGLQLAGQASGNAGATDARLSTALAGLPGAGYNPAANQELRVTMNGLAEGAFQHSQAKAQWAKNNGTGGNIEFEQQWQKAYNADLFYHMQKGDLSGWENSMSPTARARVRNQALQLRSLGAFQ